jgi:hypothetical protein
MLTTLHPTVSQMNPFHLFKVLACRSLNSSPPSDFQTKRLYVFLTYVVYRTEFLSENALKFFSKKQLFGILAVSSAVLTHVFLYLSQLLQAISKKCYQLRHNNFLQILYNLSFLNYPNTRRYIYIYIYIYIYSPCFSQLPKIRHKTLRHSYNVPLPSHSPWFVHNIHFIFGETVHHACTSLRPALFPLP